MTTSTEHTAPDFQLGDRVMHPGKPEWGTGMVANAQKTLHEGTPCQRLAIRFDRAGLKTITTAFVQLRRMQADERAAALDDPPPAACREHAVTLPDDPGALRKLMTSLPDTATDPFLEPGPRLTRVLDLYRFDGSPGSLIDWGAAQSGLADPLTRFSRHELEEYFAQFQRTLRQELGKAVREASQVEPDQLRSIARAAPIQGQRALQSLHQRR